MNFQPSGRYVVSDLLVLIIGMHASSAHMKNKLNEIESVIGQHRPLIFGISEANLLKKHKIELMS
jgi:hypothetical protein